MAAKVFTWAVAVFCGYETVAIASGRLPTLTELNRKSRHTIGPVVIAGLIVHFFWDWPKKPCAR